MPTQLFRKRVRRRALGCQISPDTLLQEEKQKFSSGVNVPRGNFDTGLRWFIRERMVPRSNDGPTLVRGSWPVWAKCIGGLDIIENDKPFAFWNGENILAIFYLSIIMLSRDGRIPVVRNQS